MRGCGLQLDFGCSPFVPTLVCACVSTGVLHDTNAQGERQSTAWLPNRAQAKGGGLTGPDTDRIRALNDQARTTLTGCRVLITEGVARLGNTRTILARVRRFDAFTPDNDPYGEHDFGAFEYAGQQVFWKIDTYDLDLAMMSPDPSDTAVTARVLTIMLAEES